MVNSRDQKLQLWWFFFRGGGEDINVFWLRHFPVHPYQYFFNRSFILSNNTELDVIPENSSENAFLFSADLPKMLFQRRKSFFRSENASLAPTTGFHNFEIFSPGTGNLTFLSQDDYSIICFSRTLKNKNTRTYNRQV